MHNVVNALGAIAVSDRLHVPFAVLASALGEFHNTRRRFEFYGERNGVKVFHDYGHHPSEIRATLEETFKLAEPLGLNGTPSYVIGKQVVIGAVGLDTLKEKINTARCGKATC